MFILFFSSLAWQAENMNEGISLVWKLISVHGISSNPSKCIYFMLDHNLEWRGVYDKVTRASSNINRNGNIDEVLDGHQEAQIVNACNVDIDEGNASDEEDENENLTECWITPDDANTVEIIFQAMSECQALHPDSADSISEESDFMDDEDNLENGIGSVRNNERNGIEDAQGGIRNLNLNDERFADADE
uniref:Methylosome subunit pICln n=1 Tax=Ceratitis capitata TaxID=7213 RepID=W8CAZ4_CERCA